jgi:hypothetical protein
MVQFRDYQKEIIEKGILILNQKGMLYLAMEVRTGKTLTALEIANRRNKRRVLFLTKKKAIKGIEKDYNLLNPSFDIVIINYESAHKVEIDCDLLIIDEAHCLGAFPKPTARAKLAKDIFERTVPEVIWLSGTPTPESYSQMYHQTYFIPGSPFYHYENFYKFALDFVDVKEKHIGGPYKIKDYSGGREEILEAMKGVTISYTQKEAGFETSIDERFLHVTTPVSLSNMMRRLKKDLVIEGKEQTILADTPVKLLSKLHQIGSGTIKFESGESMILDTFKARFIKEEFKGKKLGIFYKFKEELNAIKEVFGESLTVDVEEFDDGKFDFIALQILSGREGITLKEADALIFYNIDFSATSYWQARDRMTTKERSHNTVYWVFSSDGIEKDVYDAVCAKKDFTLTHYRQKNKTFYLKDVFCNECGVLLTTKQEPTKGTGELTDTCNLSCL